MDRRVQHRRPRAPSYRPQPPLTIGFASGTPHPAPSLSVVAPPPKPPPAHSVAILRPPSGVVAIRAAIERRFPPAAPPPAEPPAAPQATAAVSREPARADSQQLEKIERMRQLHSETMQTAAEQLHERMVRPLHHGRLYQRLATGRSQSELPVAGIVSRGAVVLQPPASNPRESSTDADRAWIDQQLTPDPTPLEDVRCLLAHCCLSVSSCA
jgi:hypothetical protein